MIKIILLVFVGFSLPLSVLAQVPDARKTKAEETLVISHSLLEKPVDSISPVQRGSAETQITQPAAKEFYGKKVLKTEGELLLPSYTLIEFKAGESIELTDGFEVDASTTFSAEIVEVAQATDPLIGENWAGTKEDVSLLTNTSTLLPNPEVEQLAFTLFPNPVVEQLVIRYELAVTAPVSITLTTLTGTTLKELRRVAMQEAGAYEETFAITQVPAGIYFVSLQRGREIRTKRIIVQ